MARGRTTVATIARLERAGCSRNGNPRYVIHWTNGMSSTTQTDAGISYGITNPEYRDVPLLVDMTPTGKVWGLTPVSTLPIGVRHLVTCRPDDTTVWLTTRHRTRTGTRVVAAHLIIENEPYPLSGLRHLTGWPFRWDGRHEGFVITEVGTNAGALIAHAIRATFGHDALCAFRVL